MTAIRKTTGKRPKVAIASKMYPEERAAAQEAANDLGMSLSEYVRLCVTGQKIRPRDNGRHELVRLLAGIGNDAARIARHLGAGGSVHAGEMVRVREAVVDALKRLPSR